MDDAVETLFGLPLDEFVPARDELAKRLRAGGDAAGARTVKALRRPSLVAWTVNQLARRRREDVTRLVESGAALRDLQGKGAGADALREASRARRELVRALSGEAALLLAEGGHASTPQTLARVAATLDAASAVAEHAEALRAGILVRETEPAGFGGLDAVEIAPRETAEPARDDQEARRKAAREAERAEREAERLREAAARAEREADDLERRAAQARERATTARKQADDAQQEADAARKISDATR